MSNIVQFPDSAPASDPPQLGAGPAVTDSIIECMKEIHAELLNECVTELLKGVPERGGRVPREVLVNIIKVSFVSGAIAQLGVSQSHQ